jgi:hypothetical protein
MSCRFGRREQVSFGQSITGRIYSFSAKTGDLIALEGEGYSLESIITEILTPDGHDFLGPGCRKDTVYKVPADGTHQLVIG